MKTIKDFGVDYKERVEKQSVIYRQEKAFYLSMMRTGKMKVILFTPQKR